MLNPLPKPGWKVIVTPVILLALITLLRFSSAWGQTPTSSTVWLPVVMMIRATTVGYQQLLRFPLASAQRVRLRILGARYSPTIKAVGLYKLHGQPLS